ncbi:MAG: two-component system response regulator [Elusimicrobia bacterium]|nr:MAG: two-component system response regulator [Elusimicrobiota bacterium]
MPKILVVDDERDVVTLLKFVLEKEGHSVSQAYNGVQALEKLGVDPVDDKAELPDLIVLDVMMPIMDGHTTARHIADHERTSKVPIVVLTAKGQMRDLFDSIGNVASYLEKPFDPRRLREMVASILGL